MEQYFPGSKSNCLPQQQQQHQQQLGTPNFAATQSNPAGLMTPNQAQSIHSLLAPLFAKQAASLQAPQNQPQSQQHQVLQQPLQQQFVLGSAVPTVLPDGHPQWRLRLLNQVLGTQKNFFLKFQQAAQRILGMGPQAVYSEQHGKVVLEELVVVIISTLLDAVKQIPDSKVYETIKTAYFTQTPADSQHTPSTLLATQSSVLKGSTAGGPTPQPELVNTVSDLASQVTKLLGVLKERKDGLSQSSSKMSVRLPLPTQNPLGSNHRLDGVTRCQSHNVLIKKEKSSFENRLVDLSESQVSNIESSLGLILNSHNHDEALPKERQMGMRQRDQKAFLKQMEKTQQQVRHTTRKGERYWSEEEHQRFIQAVHRYGKNWSKITKYVATRSRQSVYSHAQKFRKRVEKEPNLVGSECAAVLAKLDQQHFGQSSIMRARTVAIEDIFPYSNTDGQNQSEEAFEQSRERQE